MTTQLRDLEFLLHILNRKKLHLAGVDNIKSLDRLIERTKLEIQQIKISDRINQVRASLKVAHPDSDYAVNLRGELEDLEIKLSLIDNTVIS